MPAKNLVHMVEGMTFEEGALTEPATVAIHGLYQSHIQMGYEVAVVGCGNIGLMSIAWSKAFGAKRVFALDVDDGQLEIHGSWCTISAPYPGREWANAVDYIGNHKVRVTQMITHQRNMSEGPELFRRIIDNPRGFGKVLLYPEENR